MSPIRSGRRLPRTRLRSRLLIIVVATLVATTSAAVIADGLLRSRIESELASTDAPVEITLGGGSVLWSYLTGSIPIDAHLDAAQIQDAITAKAGVALGEVTMTDGTIVATLDSGPVTALLGGDVVLELAPTAVDGTLTVTISGMSVGGEERAGTAMAGGIGPFLIDPSDVMDCAAADVVTVDDASVRDDELVVSLSVPRDASSQMADCH